MPNISLGSFLKILGHGTPQKMREYSKYLTPGGYDFYWHLKDAAFALTVGGKPFDECVQPINQIKRDVERKHNFEGLRALRKWMSGKDGKFFVPPKGSCSSPKGYLTVKLEPEFGVQHGEKAPAGAHLELQGHRFKASYRRRGNLFDEEAPGSRRFR
jgi:hypothetical protein